MGIFSKYNRFHEQGEQANVNNVERFGQPVRSLYTSTKILSLHNKITITDDAGNIVYKVASKAISITDKTDILDGQGNQVAHIDRKVFSIHEKHCVSMADGRNFMLSTELLHLVKEVINIEELGWQLKGNIAELNFEIYAQDGSVIAVIGQKMLSIHDKYCIDIYKAEEEPTIIAVLIALQHIIRDRNNARAIAFSSAADTIFSSND